MADLETVITGLRDIDGFIAGRIGFGQAKNFLRTIDEAIAILKEQENKKTCCRDCEYYGACHDE